MYLKPQDLYVALYLCLEDSLSYAEMAARLGLSASETHACVNRLSDARLTVDRKIKRGLLLQFLIHGAPYAFAVKEGEITRGVPTAWGSPVLEKHFMKSDELPPVWPSPNGKVKGTSIAPLYSSVPDTAQENDNLYALLALTDALRIGKARDKKIAEKMLKERIKNHG